MTYRFLRRVLSLVVTKLSLKKWLSMVKKRRYTIQLNYPSSWRNEPRWGHGKPVHPILYEIIDRNREEYEELLHIFLMYKAKYMNIKRDLEITLLHEPFLDNIWLPALDSLALYALIAIYKPSRYVEIGSGNSTKFTRQSIIDHALGTTITSIDPEPRAEIDEICNRVLRKPVEDVDLSLFEQLEANDILFVDNSHRSFMNSDVTTVFLDILPRLKKGVLLEIHDIFLPEDYLPFWNERYYNEQYLLASYLLAEGKKFDILLPNAFIKRDPDLFKILNPIFSRPEMKNINTGGGSFWLVMK